MPTIDDIMASLVPPASDARGRFGNVRIILEEFKAAGYGPGEAMAAVANSWAESRWRNEAFGDRDYEYGSVGLFQLLKHHRNGTCIGAACSEALPRLVNGQPSPSDPRLDPRRNTQIILREVGHYYSSSPWEGYGPTMRQALIQGGDIGDLAAAFAIHIERPADRVAKGQERAALARGMFPGFAGRPARTLSWGVADTILAPVRAVTHSATRTVNSFGLTLPTWVFPTVSGVLGLIFSVTLALGLRRARRGRRRRYPGRK